MKLANQGRGGGTCKGHESGKSSGMTWEHENETLVWLGYSEA